VSGYIQKFNDVIMKKSNKHLLCGICGYGITNVLDIITTQIGLSLGAREMNPLLVPFVQNIFLLTLVWRCYS